MSSQYRLEISSTSRAGCQNAECKKAAIKIQKGELRLGVFVTIQDNQTWKWKHWGCTTPKVLQNINESIEGDLNLFDGYDDLPEEDQERVSKALEEGHVSDDDWRGDVEMNRPGMTGFRTPASKAKKKQEEKEREANENEDVVSSPAKPQTKKRGRGKKDVEEDDQEAAAPAAKKAKTSGKKSKKVKEEHEDQDIAQVPKEAKPATKKGRKVKTEDAENVIKSEAPGPAATTKKPAAKSTKDVKQEEDVEDNDATGDVAPTKAKRVTKATPRANTKAKRIENANDQVSSKQRAAPNKGKAAPKAAVTLPEVEKKTSRKGRKKANGGEDGTQEAEPATAKKNARGRGREKKAVAGQENE